MGVRYGLLVLGIIASASAVGFESVREFSERYRARTCREAFALAQARVENQKQAGNDLYVGSVGAFKGKTIKRFVFSEGSCEALWSDVQGRLFDYYLRVQVAE